jgi:hypothetical protein
MNNEHDGHASAGLAGVRLSGSHGSRLFQPPFGTARARGPTSDVGSEVFSISATPYEEPVFEWYC